MRASVGSDGGTVSDRCASSAKCHAGRQHEETAGRSSNVESFSTTSASTTSAIARLWQIGSKLSRQSKVTAKRSIKSMMKVVTARKDGVGQKF